MKKEVPDKILASCLKFWLNGVPIKQAAGNHHIPYDGLFDKFCAYTGKNIDTLRDDRLKAEADRVFKKLLPAVKAKRQYPTKMQLRELCRRNRTLQQYLEDRFKQAGFRQMHGPRIASADNTAKVVGLFLEGMSAKQIARKKKMNIRQVRYILTRYRKQQGGSKLQKLRVEIKVERAKAEALLLAGQLNRMPSAKLLSERFGYRSIYPLQKYLVEQGFIKNAPARLLSNEEMLEFLRQLAAQLGHIPSATELTEFGAPSVNDYSNRFGSFAEAQLAAGLKPNKEADPEKKVSVL